MKMYRRNVWKDARLENSLRAHSPSLARSISRALQSVGGTADHARLVEIAQGKDVLPTIGPARVRHLKVFLDYYVDPLPIPPRPRITRTTAEVYASLPPAERAEIAQVAADLDELRRENPLAVLPPSATHVYLMERAGWIWDFQDGRYTGASNAEGLQLAGGAD